MRFTQFIDKRIIIVIRDRCTSVYVFPVYTSLFTPHVALIPGNVIYYYPPTTTITTLIRGSVGTYCQRHSVLGVIAEGILCSHRQLSSICLRARILNDW
jgi:hypothetical protein